jgi:hypothetical protein
MQIITIGKKLIAAEQIAGQAPFLQGGRDVRFQGRGGQPKIESGGLTLTRNGPRAAVAEVQKSRIMHRTVTNSFARGDELNQQLYAGYDTREDPDVEIFTRERSHADIPSASSGDSHAELGSRFRQAIQPTTIDSVATISGGTPCPYSPWRVTVASAVNITVQPSAEPHSRVRGCASRTAVVSSSDPVTKWNHGGYPHRRYSS